MYTKLIGIVSLDFTLKELRTTLLALREGRSGICGRILTPQSSRHIKTMSQWCLTLWTTIARLEHSYRTQLTEGWPRAETVEHKTSLLLKRSTFAEEVCKWLHPKGTRLLRLYGLPKIHKVGVPLSPTVSNTGVPTYKLFKYLAGLLSPLVGHSYWHVTNSIEFVHSLGSLWVGLEEST
jgi:hypothetical protein